MKNVGFKNHEGHGCQPQSAAPKHTPECCIIVAFVWMATGTRGRHMNMTYIGDRDWCAEYCPHEEAPVFLRKLLGLRTCCAAWHRAGSRMLEEEEEGSVEMVGRNKEEVCAG